VSRSSDGSAERMQAESDAPKVEQDYPDNHINSMGYIQDFEVKLTELLAGVDEATRKAALTCAKRAVVESFKNGIEAGKAASVVRAVERQSRTAVRK
jgi:hypothetical protein